MKISVIVASRLQARFSTCPTCLWLERAIRSVRRQQTPVPVEFEIVVGLDPGVAFPERLTGIVVAHGDKPRQSSALNAAVQAATGELLAFLEDDDYWELKRIGYGLPLIEKYDLVTSNQGEVDEDGAFVQINDYPTPTGWLVKRDTFLRVGLFDPEFSYPDSEWLGRANAAGLKRIHLIEAGAPKRPGLQHVARHSHIGNTSERNPLILRTINPDGVMGRTQKQGAMHAKWQRDMELLKQKYGGIPW